MTKAELKAIVVQLDALGVPDTATVRVQHLDTSRIDLAAMPFLIEGKDASYSVDNSGHWAAAVSEADAVVLKQI